MDIEDTKKLRSMRKDLLQYIYDETKYYANFTIRNDQQVRAQLTNKSPPVKDSNDYRRAMQYLVTGGYLSGTMDPNTFTLAQKGNDEVENHFPTFNQLPKSESYDDLILILQNDNLDYSKVAKVEDLEHYMTRLENQMKIIQGDMQELKAESDNEEIKGFLEELASLNVVSKFIATMIKYGKNPKFRKEVVEKLKLPGKSISVLKKPTAKLKE